MSARALHLEPALDLSAECFLEVYKRFMSCRGDVSIIYSDRGINFVRCANMLKSIGVE